MHPDNDYYTLSSVIVGTAPCETEEFILEFELPPASTVFYANNPLNLDFGFLAKFRPTPTKIIKNGPALVVYWNDKTRTVVKKKPEDPDDIYSAFAQALLKKMCGSTHHAHKFIDRMLVDQEAK